MGQMHPDLVRPARQQPCLEEAVPGQRAHASNLRRGLLPVGRDADPAIAAGQHMLCKPRIERCRARAPGAMDEREVALVGPADADLFVKVRQGGSLLREQQHARRLAIEPVHEFEELRVRPGRTEPLDDAVCDAAPAVHGDARRFVDDQQCVVLEEHRQRRPPRRDRRCSRPGRGRPDRWHAHAVPEHQALGRIGTTAVDPDLPAAEDPVHVTLGDTLQDALEEVVDPLPLGLGSDFHPVD